jgi:hypothetical protein
MHSMCDHAQNNTKIIVKKIKWWKKKSQIFYPSHQHPSKIGSIKIDSSSNEIINKNSNLTFVSCIFPSR